MKFSQFLQMITFKIYIFVLLSIKSFCICKSLNNSNRLGIVSFSSNGFGPFYASTEKIEKCQNPRRKIDLNRFSSVTIGVQKLNRTKEVFNGYAYVPNNLQYHEVLMEVNYWKDGGFRQMYNNIFRNPCSDMFISTLLNFVHPDKNCFVKKGNYTFSMTKDLNDLIHLFVGDNFFYSRLSFRSEIYTKIGTVYCIKIFCQTKALSKHKKNKT